MPSTRPTLVAAAGLAAVMAAPLPARAVREQAFQARTTGQLLRLCSTPRADPAYAQAVQFRHGFAAGALSHHRAARRPGSGPAYCGLPASRQEVVDRFVGWARPSPGLAGETPADSLFRFLDANYACPGRR